jgi:hypothetical protein
MDLLDQADQVAIELTLAIKGGDIPALGRLLAARPGLASVGITGRKGRRPPWRPAGRTSSPGSASGKGHGNSPGHGD